jgi:molybdopterin converting factor small subunit
MPMIRIPTPLRSYTAGQAEVTVQGGNVNQALECLMQLHPTLRPHLYNTSGQLRPFVNLFLNEDNVKDLQGLETPLQEGDRLMLIPSIAGGRTSAGGKSSAGG